MQTNDSTPDWRQMPCDEWNGSTTAGGYGQFTLNGKPRYAHRHTWQEAHGDTLTTADVIAHHCDNRRCVEPLHLFKTDIAGNNRDMYEKGRGRGQFERKTHCIKGHSLENAMVGRSKGRTYQRCRECQRLWKKAKRAEATC